MRLLLAAIGALTLLVGCSRGKAPEPPSTPASAIPVVSPVVASSPLTNGPAPTPTLDPQVTPAGFHPRGTHAGDPHLDRVIDIVMARDAKGLVALLKASHIPCVRSRTPFSAEVTCPPGVGEGTAIEAFPAGVCQPEWTLGLAEARAVVEATPLPVLWMFAVYRSDQPVFARSEGDIRVLVFGNGTQPPPTLRIYLDASDGRIIQIDNGCRVSTRDLTLGGPPLLAPVPTPYVVPTLTPAPRPTPIVLDPAVTPTGFYSRDARTGIPVVDRILDAVMNNDSQALASLVTTQHRPCTRFTRTLTDDVRCPPGVPEATVVEVFPSGACNLGWIFGGGQARSSTGHLATMLLWPYAVARLADASFATSGGTGFVIVLGQALTSSTVARIWVDAREGSIVQIGGSCGTIGNTAGFGGTFILPPLP